MTYKSIIGEMSHLPLMEYNGNEVLTIYRDTSVGRSEVGEDVVYRGTI